ncbi:hypothetical protein [Microbacterium sp. W4I20]|uniref:hypothetical protein n=1 Tax=Microbacterium sp. W4I20 TaxID=3042262 RepID=UPI00278391A7|nr:hypothetical protein [Microbacterium sp. W4I20]MDQ0729137.1 hypothetical protein [Microbacterium sp. W4I20]
MKHLTYGEKAHFLGDDAAQTLMEYASVLGNANRSDTVTLTAVDDHGNYVEATFLLNPSTVMLMESSSSDMQEPENAAGIEYMRAQISQLESPPEIVPEDGSPSFEEGRDHSRME